MSVYDTVNALLEQGVSVDEFYDFIYTYGIQEDPFIQEVLHRLLVDQVIDNPGSPKQWDAEAADDLLEMLKSPKERDSSLQPSLKETDINLPVERNDIQMVKGAVKVVPFECQHCDKSFAIEKDLYRHVKSVHENVKFTCSQCDKIFTRMYNLKAHQSKYHGPVAENVKHTCSQCDKFFISFYKLKAHQSKCRGPNRIQSRHQDR